MATQADPFQQFLASIGANRLDSAGRPVGSTGGAVAVSPDQEQQLAQFRAPAQASGGPVAAAAPAQGQGAPTQANPLSKLNSALGLNIGAPFQGAALRQATDSMPAATQMAGAFGQLDETRKAALIAQRIQDAGINLDPTQPGFEAQKRAAEGIYNSMQGGQPGGMFTPQPITAYAPTGLRDRAIGANGGEVAGAGGVMVSTRGTNAEGGNRFMLRSGPKPPDGLTGRPAPVQQPVQAQQGTTPLQQQQEAYRAALAPKEDVPSGYRMAANGKDYEYVKGGPADPSTKTQNLTQTQRNAEYTVEQGIKAGAIKPEERDEAVAVFSQEIMGRAPKFPSTERDTAVGNAKYLQTLDALSELVQQSVDSGSDDFGPVANRAKRWSGAMFSGLGKKARQIEQTYLEAGSAKAFGEGGKQLTTTEKEMTFGQIGSPTDDDFPERLAAHRERAANVATLQLERLRASPYRFTSDGKAAIGQLEKAIAGLTGGKQSVQPKQEVTEVDSLVELYTK
jgi:hypothetical protein